MSGLTFRVNPDAPAGTRVSEVRVANAPLDPNRTYTLAIPDFLLAGGDGYTMFKGQKVLVGPEVGSNRWRPRSRSYVAERREVAPDDRGAYHASGNKLAAKARDRKSGHEISKLTTSRPSAS